MRDPGLFISVGCLNAEVKGVKFVIRLSLEIFFKVLHVGEP